MDVHSTATRFLDYTVAIDMCPWSVDPVLNRGVLYENTARLELAERDYRCVPLLWTPL